MRTTGVATAITDQPQPLQQVITLQSVRWRRPARADGRAGRQRAAQRRAENLDGRMHEQRSSGGGKSVRGPLVLPELRCPPAHDTPTMIEVTRRPAPPPPTGYSILKRPWHAISSYRIRAHMPRLQAVVNSRRNRSPGTVGEWL